MGSVKYLLLTICLVSILHQGNTKKYFGSNKQDNRIPKPNEAALMARYVVHNSDWASVGTISVTPEITGYPFVGLKSIADGPANNGTGIVYMLMTDMDVSMNDINHNNKTTLFLSLAQGDYCKTKDYDPQDPRCARVMLTGSVTKVEKDSAEDVFAKKSLYEKHPAMSGWPIDHNFYVARLNLVQISLIDFFGGIKHVTPTEYYAANEKTNSDYVDNLLDNIEVIQITY